ESLRTLSEWTFALDDYPTSPSFVPRGPLGAEGRSRYAGRNPGGHHGYLVVLVHNDDRFRVELFDAAAVSAGPVAVLAPARGIVLPFMIHSAWLPRAVPAPPLERLHFADDLDSRLSTLDPDLIAVTREVAAELG
ncbi:MAG: carotenoid oxygenase, partial [Streptosporangiaceae bacterium]